MRTKMQRNLQRARPKKPAPPKQRNAKKRGLPLCVVGVPKRGENVLFFGVARPSQKRVGRCKGYIIRNIATNRPRNKPNAHVK